MKNTLVKIGVGSALALGYAAAHAQVPLPSTGSSDMVLFVYDATSGESYAGVTNISIDSLLPNADIHNEGGTSSVSPYNQGHISGSIATTISVGPTTNLTNFLGTVHAGDQVSWALLGGEYTSAGGPTAPAFESPGAAKYVTTSATNYSGGVNVTTNELVTWADGFDTDVGTLNTNLAGNSSIYGSGSANNGVWNSTTAGANINDWYLAGPYNGTALGSSALLYAVTGNGGGSGGTDVQMYSLTSITLTAGGVLENTPTAVPIPAALWLLGSGLLGLAGVGRRRSTAA